jgi:membrane protease subunit HflK
MPWNNQSGGNGTGPSGPQGPWGRGPSGSGGGGGVRPPNLEEFLRRGQDRLRNVLPGGFTAGSLTVAALVVLVIWLLSGIYFVGPDEQGVVVQFGKFVARTAPGPNYHLPWPIQTVETPKVTRENQINIGYRFVTDNSGAESADDVEQESLILTGDENIVDVNFTVFWQIKDAAAYLFNVENPYNAPDATIKAVAESAMREAVGENQIDRILTQDREPVQIQVRELMQKALDSYDAGVTITRVQMQKVDPPPEVIGAYRDVQAARADQERARNEAEAYANKIIPEARGQAARIVQEAEAYRQQVIAEATGQSKRFSSVYAEYRKAPDVTRKRMYLETMSRVFAPINKVIVDDSAKGVVPYFQLPQMLKNSQVTEPVPQVSNPVETVVATPSGGNP